MIYKQKALFCTYVFTRTPNPQEFRRRRSLDDVQASSRLRRTFLRENFTSGSRRPAISSSMLKFPIDTFVKTDSRPHDVTIFDAVFHLI